MNLFFIKIIQIVVLIINSLNHRGIRTFFKKGIKELRYLVLKRITIRTQKFVTLLKRESKSSKKKPIFQSPFPAIISFLETRTFLFLFLICEKVRRKGRFDPKLPLTTFSSLSFFPHRCKRCSPPTRREIEASLIRACSTLIPPHLPLQRILHGKGSNVAE